MGGRGVSETRVIVVGGGVIGLGMTAVLADSGAHVTLVEPSGDVRRHIPERLTEMAAEMATAGLACRKPDGGVAVVAALREAPHQTDIVIEAGPEDVVFKRAAFNDIRAHCGDTVPIATTSSAITISHIVERQEDRRHCLVAHPANPPHLIRVVECVPAPETDRQVTKSVADRLADAGFNPIVLSREVEGFALNRLQSALLREAYRLVEAGIVDVAGVDRLVAEGLGPRWALSGPFETADLNTAGGIAAHARRLGPAYARIGQENGEKGLPWPDSLVADVTRQRREIVPEAAMPARIRWRRKALVGVMKARAAALDLWKAEKTSDG